MIGLFLGDTDFSKTILNKIKKLNKEYFIIDLSKNNIFRKDKNSYRISIGKFGKIIDLINKKKSKKVLFAGKILKPNFSTLRLDLKGIYYMPSIIKAAKIGDAEILKTIIKILSKEKINVIRSNFFSPELSLKAGNYSKIKANFNDISSIKKGIKYFKSLNSLDHVQAIIVKDDRIIAKEGKQGTKKMISKLKKKSGGILIKLPKPKQDLRLDLKGIYYMPSIIKAAKIGDAAIIKAIIKILSNEGIKVISSIFFNPELSLKKGNFSKIKPSKQDMVSIKKGQLYFNKINNLDHIQALVVKDGKIIAKEGRGGTKKMLSKLRKNTDGILIKLPKKKQDLRMDLPTIGLQTLKDIKKHGLKGVVLKSKKNIFLNKKKVIAFANKNKIFINIIWRKFLY